MTLLWILFDGLTLAWQLAVIGAYVFSYWTRIGSRIHACAAPFVRAHRDLWIVAPVGLVGHIARECGDGDLLGTLFAVLTFITWWLLRNWPEDNVWKRRGRKARERIAERAGRLTVVPESA